MASIIVKLECITNMHVGNGDVNYNIIDNEVEKDPVTNYPTINASGVKGSLRQFYSETPSLQGDLDQIFGRDAAASNGNTSSGRLKFFGADFLARPVRASKGEEAFYLVTTKAALERYEQLCKEFGDGRKPVRKTSDKKCAVEGIDIAEYAEVDGQALYLISDEDYRRLALPVMARNKLDNGKSVNLWYEEIVPYKSRFFFAVLAQNTEEDRRLLEAFRQKIDGQVIQFGGNASIGYGLCKVTVMKDGQREQG